MTMEIVTEGKTKLKVYLGKISKKLPVFFNPAKEFDRDLSVAFAEANILKTALDLLAASGARGIRLLKEANLDFVHFNDVNEEATKLIEENLKLNEIPKEKYKISNEEANLLLATLEEKFDFVDIDPFGSPINFVANAIPRVGKGKFLAVTATDTAPLYGVYPKKCLRKYGSVPLKNSFAHETALRILAKAVIELGAKQDFALEPVFSHATKHYYRIYFRKTRRVGKILEELGYLFYCPNCGHRFYTKLEQKENCPVCGSNLLYGGLLYLGDLNDTDILSNMVKFSRHKNFLETLISESRIKVPFHYELGEFKFKTTPKIGKIAALLVENGYKFSRTHYSGTSFKTDADFATIKKLCREFYS